MIDSTMVPVIIPETDETRGLIALLHTESEPSGQIARRLQGHIVQVPLKQRDVLHRNGKGDFVAPALRGDRFFVLIEPSLYSPDVGLWWEQSHYLAADKAII